jgi:predicted anti-sigma-YlaC factor YlaD
MKNACEKWKDQLREATLTGASTPELAEHLQTCADCSAELRELEERRARLDVLLPRVAQSAQPSADFRARVVAAAEAAGKRRRMPRWQAWTLAGAATTAAIVLVIGAVWHGGTTGKIPAEELAAAQKLAEWRAPSDSLLATPGQEILRTTPKLGESYLHVPMKEVEEER